MSSRAEWQPDWRPLERSLEASGIAVAPCTAFMWMYRSDGLEFYKHIHTRRYVILDSNGGCYSYASEGLVRVPFLTAYQSACDGSRCSRMPVAKEASRERRHS